MAEGGDDSRAAVLEKLMEHVTCTVCLGFFDEPKALTCTHAFCTDCINRLPVDIDKGHHKLRCPNCREFTTLPVSDDAAAESLPKAFLAKNLLELYQNLEGTAGDPKPKVAVQCAPQIARIDQHTQTIPTKMDQHTQTIVAKKDAKLLVKLKNRVAIVGRPRSFDIMAPSVGWLKRNELVCHLVADIGSGLIRCAVKHIEKKIYRVSFTPTHPGLHHIKIWVDEVDTPCDPSLIHILPKVAGISRAKTIASGGNRLLLAATTDGVITVIREFQVVTKVTISGSSPRGLCITRDNCVMILNSAPPHVVKYTAGFDHILATAHSGVGSRALQFHSPLGIAVSSSGHVYVCDTNNHRIQVLNPDLTFSHMFGQYGKGLGQFNSPCGIAVDSQDNIYICDHKNLRVQKFPMDGNLSRFTLPLPPQYIAIDADNNMLYITTRHTVFVCTSEGEVVNTVEGVPRSDGVVDYQGVAVDRDHVYVCDNDVIVF